MPPRPLLFALGALVASACHDSRAPRERVIQEGVPLVRVREAFFTPPASQENIDSPAIWRGSNGEHLVIVTAKASHRLLAYDAATGAAVWQYGRRGPYLGQFGRPNGLAVIGDLAFVVERDNHRVQVLHLPDLRPLGAVGQTVLRRPYGVAGYADRPGVYQLYVTDNYETALGTRPADAHLDSRVVHYRLSIAGNELGEELIRTFGDTTGPGVLRVVESIAVDVPHQRLLIADEHAGRNNLKVYTLDGRFTGQTLGDGLFRVQPEGIVLYACDADGVWITTDQAVRANVFHVFDRRDLTHLGSFAGHVTTNTDGVALTQVSVDGHPGGLFFAVDDDRRIAAFGWHEIAQSLRLHERCS